MKTFLYFLVSLFAAFACQANTYRSINAEVDARLVIVPTEHSNQFLVGFDGFNHEFDRQAMLYEKRMNSSDARDGFHYQMVGTPYINVRNNERKTLLMGSMIPYIEVHLADRAPIMMVFTEQSDIAMQQRLQQRYQQKQGYSVSRIEARKQVNQANDLFKTECNPNIQFQIDWEAFSEQDDRTTPAVAARYVEALSKICSLDTDYKQAVSEISLISFGRSQDNQQHQVKRSGAELSIALAKDHANITETSYTQLMEMF